MSVAFAGFSAIVVIFRRRDSGLWRAEDADRFHGMVLHAVAAVFFCLLPSMVGVFAARAEAVWTVSSAILGLQIVGHVAIVLRLPTTGSGGRTIVLGAGLAAALLQGLNVAGVGFPHEFGPYLLGVLWHVFQSGVLFVWLIWVAPEDIESP